MTNKVNHNRQKLLAIATVSIIVFTILYLLIVEPATAKVHRHNLDIARLTAELIKAHSDIYVKDRIEQQYDKIKDMMTSAGSQQQEISQFTKELNSFYSKMNIQIKSIKILPAEEHKHYRKISVKFEFTGLITDVLGFILKMETAALPISIDRMTIKAGASTDKVLTMLELSKITSINQ